MMTSEYGKRVIALFESGKASKAEKAELVEALLCASERGLKNVVAVHKAIGFAAEQAEADRAERKRERAIDRDRRRAA